MAQNPRFNNSGMFTGVSDDYSDITPNSTSEVLATQGNVINSIKVFWNKLRAKLAYAVTRPNFDTVGGHYQPVYIDEHGVVQVCAPETIVANIEGGSNINIGNIPVHPGKTICVRFNGNFGGSATALRIGHVPVIYPSGADVYPANVNIDGTYLFTYMAGVGSTKWVLISSMNVADDTNSGLMTAAEHTKLYNIQEGANNYSLPAATDKDLGGVQLGYKGNGRNYQVQKDDNNNLFVNVPWTDTDTHNTASVAMTTDKSDSPNITLTDGSSSSSIQVVGLGGTQVAVGKEGQLVIDSQPSVTYNNLKDSLNPSSGDNIPVTVPYPYLTNTNKPTRFLNAAGNWVTPVTKLFNTAQGTSGVVSLSSGKVTSPISIYTADGKRLFCLFMGTENVAGVVLISSKIPAFSSSDNIYIPFFPLGLEEDWYNNPGYDTRFKPGVIRIYKTSSTSEAQVRIL